MTTPPRADDRPPPRLLPGAHEEADRMYGVVLGYWTSQVAGTLARLAVPDLLAGRCRTTDDLAAELGCPRDPLDRLLRVAAVAGIVTLGPDGAVGLTTMGSTLRSDVPGSLRGLARTLTAPCHWLPWGRLEDAVRTGACPGPAALGAPFFGYLAQHPDEQEQFIEAMEGLSAMIAEAVVDVLDLTGVRDVVDVGGGSGHLLADLLEHHPGVHGTVLELPAVAPSARALLAGRGLTGRADVVEGDFFDRVPEADAHLLKLITHDWDDQSAATILRTCAASLRPGGRVYVIDAVVPDDLSEPLPVLLDLHMHVVLGGRERTATQHERLLAAAGVRLDRILPTRSHAQELQASVA